MSDFETTQGQHESPQPIELDLHDPEIQTLLIELGKLYRRKETPVRTARFPESPEQIDTIIDGTIENSRLAEPGKDMVLTGAKGEEFVRPLTDIGTIFDLVPKERLLVAAPNPYGAPIRIRAPWSTPDSIEFQEGAENAILAFSLDPEGNLSDDRYIIGDEELLLANYELVNVEAETEKRKQAALKFLRIWHGIKGHPGKDLEWKDDPQVAICRCGGHMTRADLRF